MENTYKKIEAHISQAIGQVKAALALLGVEDVEVKATKSLYEFNRLYKKLFCEYSEFMKEYEFNKALEPTNAKSKVAIDVTEREEL